MHEEWRDVAGYEGFYQVSNLGNVRSVDRLIWNGVSHFHKNGMVLKQGIHRKGYHVVYLSVHNKSKAVKVHRLVASAFIDNPCGFSQVNHIDGDKDNNKVDNLEWCDALHNNRHALKNGLVSHENMWASLRRAVFQKDVKTGRVIKKYDSVSEAAKNIGSGTAHICDVCNGKRKTSHGYIWEYADEKASSPTLFDFIGNGA